ncbi:MAG: hypothetical protein KDD61_00225 [Bdellovibrionales bacterium]|nr:hypothetical protein [Bdellovibrionales bacterium]
MNKKKQNSIVNKLLDDLLEDEPVTSVNSTEDDESIYDISVDTSENVYDMQESRASKKAKNYTELKGEEIPSYSDFEVENDDEDQTIEVKPRSIKAHKKTEVESDDNTIAVPVEPSDPGFDSLIDTQQSVRVGVGRFSGGRSFMGGGTNVGTTDAILSQSEALRIAQQRITEVEEEVERLREENEGLAAAGEAISKHVDELKSKLARAEAKNKDMEERFEEEKTTLLEAIQIKDEELERRRIKQEEFDARLSSNLRKVRVRERELENRLELVKMEGAALLRSKDEIILDLKRQLDQAQQEIESYRSKGQDLGRQLGEKQEMLRRTVKALRLALSMLDGEEGAGRGSSGEKAG